MKRSRETTHGCHRVLPLRDRSHLQQRRCPVHAGQLRQARSSYLLAAQDALQVDLFEEGEDWEPGAALVLVKVGQHA